MCIMDNDNDQLALYPGNFLMKNMNSTNIGLISYNYSIISTKIVNMGLLIKFERY